MRVLCSTAFRFRAWVRGFKCNVGTNTLVIGTLKGTFKGLGFKVSFEGLGFGVSGFRV